MWPYECCHLGSVFPSYKLCLRSFKSDPTLYLQAQLASISGMTDSTGAELLLGQSHDNASLVLTWLLTSNLVRYTRASLLKFSTRNM